MATRTPASGDRRLARTCSMRVSAKSVAPMRGCCIACLLVGTSAPGVIILGLPTRVLLLLPTRSYRAAAFLGAAARLGLEVVVGSDQGSSLGHLMEGRQLVVDLDRPDRVAARGAGPHP